MRATGQTRRVRRLPRPHVVTTSVLTGLMLTLVGTGRALAGPAPVDNPHGGAGTRPAAGGVDSGFDWTSWLLVGAGVVIVLALISAVASSTRSHRPAHI